MTQGINITTSSKSVIICACKQIISELEGKEFCDEYTLKFIRHYDDW